MPERRRRPRQGGGQAREWASELASGRPRVGRGRADGRQTSERPGGRATALAGGRARGRAGGRAGGRTPRSLAPSARVRTCEKTRVVCIRRITSQSDQAGNNCLLIRNPLVFLTFSQHPPRAKLLCAFPRWPAWAIRTLLVSRGALAPRPRGISDSLLTSVRTPRAGLRGRSTPCS